MPGPLDGIRVLDFSRVLAGPWCAQMLGDLGAEVIKIESPEGDDVRFFGPPFEKGESAYFQVTNRNKQSIVVDLKTDEGKAIARDLALKSDVIIENLRRGAMEKYGLGYEQLKADNPGLIFCAVSGYGRTGPAAERAGYDFLIQAESGLMSLVGGADQPPTKVGTAITDMVAGQGSQAVPDLLGLDPLAPNTASAEPKFMVSASETVSISIWISDQEVYTDWVEVVKDAVVPVPAPVSDDAGGAMDLGR